MKKPSTSSLVLESLSKASLLSLSELEDETGRKCYVVLRTLIENGQVVTTEAKSYGKRGRPPKLYSLASKQEAEPESQPVDEESSSNSQFDEILLLVRNCLVSTEIDSRIEASFLRVDVAVDDAKLRWKEIHDLLKGSIAYSGRNVANFKVSEKDSKTLTVSIPVY